MANNFEDAGIPVGKIIFWFAVVVVVFMALGWVTMGNDFFMYKWLAPREAAVGREVFENSNSYNRGTIVNLRDAEQNYITAPADRRSGLGSVIISQYADYPNESMPRDLRDFMNCLRNHQDDDYNCSPGAVH